MSSTVLTKTILTSSALAPASGGYGAWLAAQPRGAAVVAAADHGTAMSRHGLIPAAVGTGVDVCPDTRHRLAFAKAIDEPVVTFTRLARTERRTGESL